MGRIISSILLSCYLIAETKIWDSHSAYLLPQKRWEIGLFQPFRYGYSDKLEYSVYPLWFFVMPNISLKKPYKPIGSFTSAFQSSLFYPTPFLNMIAKKDILGFISPEFQIPPMLGLSGTFLISNNIAGVDLTVNGGLDLGLVMGDLDYRSTIDLPLVYHRLGVYYNNWGMHMGLDIQKSISSMIEILVDIDYRLLPEFPLKQLGKNYSIEHKLILSWRKSDHFRLITGYKFVMGEFPYGSDMRLLPYIPLVERWVPIIELQWAGRKK
tara:strand:+ start:8325 stop:9128 length:804 start_codon:yes stop_codon:yes gene_type:complete